MFKELAEMIVMFNDKQPLAKSKSITLTGMGGTFTTGG